MRKDIREMTDDELMLYKEHVTKSIARYNNLQMAMKVCL